MVKLFFRNRCSRSLKDLNIQQAQTQFLYVNIAVVLICVGIEIYFTDKFKNVPPPVAIQGPRRLALDCKGRRLGNLMFNYAALLGIAKRNYMIPVFPDGLSIGDVFNLEMKVGYFDYNFGMYINHEEFGARACAYDRTTENLFKQDINIRLLGYYQSWKYFKNVKDELRRHFAFKSHITMAANDYLYYLIPREISKKDLVKVGVHIRRGDMTVKYFADFGYVTAGVNYIYRAMDYFRKFFTNVIFVVCSDDIKWCKENIKSKNVVFSEGNDMTVDMAILASCQHTIMTVGSFGWWSAWLANGTTVYYKDWPRPVSRLEYQVEKADYFPPHWIPM